MKAQGYLQTGGKKSFFSCSYCKRDITQQLRIQCAQCEHFDLCGDCFAAGVSRFPHENTHDYRVVDCIDIPMFTRDWTASEEILMLEGIDKFGCGNWKNVADYISSKNIKQVEEHYWEVYMGFHGYCLPAKTIVNDELVSTESLLKDSFDGEDKIENIKKKEIINENENGTKNLMNNINNSSSKNNNNTDSNNLINNKAYLYELKIMDGYIKGEEVVRDRFKELVKNKDRQMQEIRDRNALLPGSDLPGFIPLREDFDFEYENDAELLLADMEFGPDDHPSERELKLQVIKIYNSKLDDREKRKRFVIDRGLIDRKEQQLQDRRRTKEERELVARLRIFARFHSAADHEALVDGLLRARKLRSQIEIYQHYRRMGIRTLDQARQYEVDRKRRDYELKVRKQRSETPYLFETGRERGSGGGNVRTSSSSSATGTGTGSGSGPSAISSSAPVAGGRRTSGGRRGRGEEWEEIEDSEAEVQLAGRAGRTAPRGTTSSSSSSISGKNKLDNDSNTNNSNNNCEDGHQTADILKAPGADLLSEKEILLCSSVPMLPMHYLAAKDAVVREAYRNGTLTTEGVRRVLRLNPNKIGKIADFFVREIAEAVPRAPINGFEKNNSTHNSAVATVPSAPQGGTLGANSTIAARISNGLKHGKSKSKGGNLKLKYGSKRKAGEEGHLDGDLEEAGEEEDEDNQNNLATKI